MAFILGTAGHVDHGKTTLVQVLSGVNCDTLKEEQERGITIDLGFVEVELSNGRSCSIVDVPGHEKFIKNMVAGVTGIHAVLFVISAEEGIMPQTKEHLEILSLLGLKEGVIVLTKIDAVEEDWLDLIEVQIKEFFTTTVFASVPIIRISSKTGEGINHLIEQIAMLENKLHCKNNTMPFRLPIDRVFTVKGHGTVVTGSIISGEVCVQDALQVYPNLQFTKAKSVHNHNKKVESNGAGTRTAINVYNLECKELARGDTIAIPNSLILSRIWEVELTCLESSPLPIKHRGQIHFHHYTKEVLARIYCLDKGIIEPGKTAICHVYFEEDMAGIAEDRCIIRSCSPLRTIAGCKILNPLNRVDSYLNKKNKDPALFFVLQNLAKDKDSIKKVIIARLDIVQENGLSLLEISLLVNIPQNEVKEFLLELLNSKEVICMDSKNSLYISFGVFKKHLELSRVFIVKMQNSQVNGLNTGVPLSYLYLHYTPRLSESFFSYLINILIENGVIEKRGEYLFDTSQVFRLNKKQEELYKSLVSLYKEAELMPPTNSIIEEKLSCSTQELLTILVYLKEEGMMVRIRENYWCYAPYIVEVKKRVYTYFLTSAKLTITDFKTLVGDVSRKYLVYLLEYLDGEKITLRIDTYRTLRK